MGPLWYVNLFVPLTFPLICMLFCVIWLVYVLMVQITEGFWLAEQWSYRMTAQMPASHKISYHTGRYYCLCVARNSCSDVPVAIATMDHSWDLSSLAVLDRLFLMFTNHIACIRMTQPSVGGARGNQWEQLQKLVFLVLQTLFLAMVKKIPVCAGAGAEVQRRVVCPAAVHPAHQDIATATPLHSLCGHNRHWDADAQTRLRVFTRLSAHHGECQDQGQWGTQRV